MSTQSDKIRTLTVFIGLSVLVHLLVLISLGMFGNYNFAAPVNPLQAVIVDVTKPRDASAPVSGSNTQKTSQTENDADIFI
jgi:hypothetical protein